MDATPPAKACPKCGSSHYAFRSRKQIAVEGKGEGTETKYKCKACDHTWKVHVVKETG